MAVNPKHIISLGAGVQSSTLALMAAVGEITPMPDCAIFADTQCEPSYVYEQLEYIRSLVPFPIVVVTKSSLVDNLFQDGFCQIPSFFDTSKRRLSRTRRQCTTKWKIEPVHKGIRAFYDVKGKRLPLDFVTQWIGISTDEAARMKDSREPWIKHRYPLIEMGMSRKDCLTWLKRNEYLEPKRSACTFCPLQSKAEWREKRERGGEEWKQILDVEIRVQNQGEFLDPFGVGLDNFIDNIWPNQPNLFINECEGMCGV